jgi:hypothetical protein
MSLVGKLHLAVTTESLGRKQIGQTATISAKTHPRAATSCSWEGGDTVAFSSLPNSVIQPQRKA